MNLGRNLEDYKSQAKILEKYFNNFNTVRPDEVGLRVVPTEYTELQPLLSGVHSVIRVKFALAGEGGRCTPTPFYYIYHHQ